MLAKTVKLLPGERMGWWSSDVRPTSENVSSLNDVRTSILLDTEANVSIITTNLARRLRLEPIQEHGRPLEVQGIQEGKMSTTTRVKAKVGTHAGSEVVLGTDFMIPAGIRLDLFNATAKLAGEEMVPLVKSQTTDEDSAEGMHVTGGPTKSLQIPAGEWIEFRLHKRKPSLGTHDVWVQRTAALIPTIIRFRKGQPTLVRLTNITDRVVYCPAHLDVIAWVHRGFMPKQAGYLECELYERWLTSQPPLVEQRPYTWPTTILQKLDEYLSDGDNSQSQDEQWSMEPVAQSVDSATHGSAMGDDPVSAAVALRASTPTPTECFDTDRVGNNSSTETHSDEKSPDTAVADLEHTFM
ncbi:hypothetical protein PHMEG_0007505 [Phytophthora megakarya]|uniref:Peptidase A2 domain-containing protein n=1 Tax=Phytophthora megakarya TaxID=4795 RepID=A0A225WNC9_9STRA|nr:hypothetical protein PHMEG_0007505 [Phytophthora megakarya]